MTDLEKRIRAVPDFPKPGILFRDVTPLLQDPIALRTAIGRLDDLTRPLAPDAIGAFDARGFLFGAPLAMELGVPFFPVRKAGKLPYETIRAQYALEYGTDAVEIHVDALERGNRVVLIDDLLATGGTMRAGCELVERLGGTVVGCRFLIELDGLNGRERLAGYDVASVLHY